MQEMWKSFLNKITQGDAIELLKNIPDNLIDIVLTDPPYNISQEILIHRAGGDKYKKPINLNFGSWDSQWANKQEFKDWTYKWVKECFRVLRSGGHFITAFDRNYITWFVEWAEENDFKTRQQLMLVKSNPLPMYRKVCFMSGIENLIWLTKHTVSKKKATFNHEYGYTPNYIICPVPSGSDRWHETQKPFS